MKVFKLENNKLLNIKQVEFKLEKEIQTLTEDNLLEVFDFELVKSEFSLNNFRIDTLAYDKKENCFIIIEYKRDKNFSVIDQGYAYLSLMLNNKADFILEYNEHIGSLNRNEVDWSQSKVIFISPIFTTYQKEAINFKDLPIELWEIKKYTNNSVIYNQIKKPNIQESIKTITKSEPNTKIINNEIKTYTEEMHLEKTKDNIKELYFDIKNRVLSLGDYSVITRKFYIAFISNKNFLDIVIQKNGLKLFLNLPFGKLNDNENIFDDVSNVGHWGNGDYQLIIKDNSNLDYIMFLVKQSIDYNS